MKTSTNETVFNDLQFNRNICYFKELDETGRWIVDIKKNSYGDCVIITIIISRLMPTCGRGLPHRIP